MYEVLVGVEESGGVEKRNGRLRPEKRVKKKGEGGREPEEGDYTLETEGEGRGTKGSKQQRDSPSVTLGQCNGQPLSHSLESWLEKEAIIKTSISTAEI